MRKAAPPSRRRAGPRGDARSLHGRPATENPCHFRGSPKVMNAQARTNFPVWEIWSRVPPPAATPASPAHASACESAARLRSPGHATPDGRACGPRSHSSSVVLIHPSRRRRRLNTTPPHLQRQVAHIPSKRTHQRPKRPDLLARRSEVGPQLRLDRIERGPVLSPLGRPGRRPRRRTLRLRCYNGRGPRRPGREQPGQDHCDCTDRGSRYAHPAAHRSLTGPFSPRRAAVRTQAPLMPTRSRRRGRTGTRARPTPREGNLQ